MSQGLFDSGLSWVALGGFLAGIVLLVGVTGLLMYLYKSRL